MAEFVNTIDTLGDEETLECILSHEQTTFNDDTVESLCDYAFDHNDALTTIKVPSAEVINAYAFQYCTNLKTLNISNATDLKNYAIQYCYRLTDLSSTDELVHLRNYNFKYSPVGIVVCPKVTTLGTYLGQEYGASGFDFTNQVTIQASGFRGKLFSTLILRSSTMCTLSNVNAFTDTPIAGGYGYIYVPDSLVDTYKAASNWSTFASRIVSLEEYPKEFDGGTITDSWSEIFAAEDNGTYKTKYNIGDTKALNWNGACVLMQIAAFDEDDLADNTGKAKITWISVGFVAYKSMNPTDTTTGGWADCEQRDYMQRAILPNINSAVRSNIKPVTKISYDYSTSSNITTTDSVWIPSEYEMTGTTDIAEKTGACYTGLFGTVAHSSPSTSRIKKHNPCGTGSAGGWWLRSASSALRFHCVGSSGVGDSSVGAATSYGLVLGFCT